MIQIKNKTYRGVALHQDHPYLFDNLSVDQKIRYLINLQQNAVQVKLFHLDEGLYGERTAFIHLSTKMSQYWLKQLLLSNMPQSIVLYDELVAIKERTQQRFLQEMESIEEVDKKWLLSAKVFIDFCLNYKLDITL